MTGFLLDTNVISETTRPNPESNVIRWIAGLPPAGEGSTREGVRRLVHRLGANKGAWLVPFTDVLQKLGSKCVAERQTDSSSESRIREASSDAATRQAAGLRQAVGPDRPIIGLSRESALPRLSYRSSTPFWAMRSGRTLGTRNPDLCRHTPWRFPATCPSPPVPGLGG